jgi:hypothetical protein
MWREGESKPVRLMMHPFLGSIRGQSATPGAQKERLEHDPEKKRKPVFRKDKG